MTLWKNVKKTKISELVNNHLNNSQKRRDGSAFVVETGFPTSLIDLFIKNREKLQKPSKKKRSKPSIIVPPKSVYNQVIEGSPTPYPSPVSSPSRVISSPLPLRGVDEIEVVKDCDFVDEKWDIGVYANGVFKDCDFVDEKRNCGVDANGVFVAVLKLFLVVILALGIKRLAVGFTLSAFLLFFLGSFGKRVSEMLKLRSEAKGVLLLCSILRLNEDKLDQKNDDSSFCLENSESRISNHEIQIVERKDSLANREEGVRLENDDSCFEGRFGCQETESTCGVEELKRRKRRDKIKLKMKIFVPKKLHISKKEEHHPKRLETDKIALSEELKVDQRKDECGSVSGSSYKVSNANGESVWRYLVLVLIILIGLVGGRAVAFLLTLSWCLLLKFGETLQRYIKGVL